MAYRIVPRRATPEELPLPEVIVRTERPDGFESMKKDELVNTAKAQGLDSSGTKADIIARLRNVDHGD